MALVGATEREGALGNIVYRNLAAGGLGERLYAVNPKYAWLHGRPAYPRLTRLPEPAEVAVIVTPARTVPGIIDDAGAAGVKAAIVLSSGFAEAGDAGLALQQETLEKAKRHRMRILGPSCLGAMRADIGVNATFARKRARPGHSAAAVMAIAIQITVAAALCECGKTKVK